MVTGANRFRHFILGLLTHRPMSGYDIKRFLQSLGWLVGNPSFGSIYPALHALLRDDLATVEILAFPNKPPRKIYSITDKGQCALGEWLQQPTADGGQLRNFVMRLLLSEQLPHEGLVTHLRTRREEVSTHLAVLEKMQSEMESKDNIGQQLVLNYGIAVAAAEIAWLDDRLNSLSVGRPVLEDMGGDP